MDFFVRAVGCIIDIAYHSACFGLMKPVHDEKFAVSKGNKTKSCGANTRKHQHAPKRRFVATLF